MDNNANEIEFSLHDQVEETTILNDDEKGRAPETTIYDLPRQVRGSNILKMNMLKGYSF